jgi:hypothetical protein
MVSSPPIDSEISPFDGLEQSRVIHYSRLQAFGVALEQLRNNVYHSRTTNQYLIVRDVDEDIMKHIEDRGYKGVRYEWHSDLEVLIVKVPTRAHKTAAAEFGCIIIGATLTMGIPPIERRLTGAATFQAAVGTPKKEGDWSMMPVNVRPNRGDFPTIVVEVGFSESLRKLRHDARLWFSMSNNDVQIVILIAVRVASNQVIFEKWVLVPIPAGRQATRHTPVQIPQAEQSITVTRTLPNTFTITAGTAPLTLEFHKLFLRLPVGGEYDIVYTQAELFAIAQAIFELA